MYFCPCFACSSASLRESDTLIVLMEMCVEPFGRLSMTLFECRTADSTAWSSASIVMAISASEAASPGECATFTPSAFSGSALAAVRFHTVTVCPARTRCRAIALPMLPKPMNAMFIGSSFRKN